jgi:hypothetical protein
MFNSGQGARRALISWVGGQAEDAVHQEDEEWAMGLGRTTGNPLN